MKLDEIDFKSIGLTVEKILIGILMGFVSGVVFCHFFNVDFQFKVVPADKPNHEVVLDRHWHRGPVPYNTEGAGYIIMKNGKYAGRQILAKFEDGKVITLWNATEVVQSPEDIELYNSSAKKLSVKEINEFGVSVGAENP